MYFIKKLFNLEFADNFDQEMAHKLFVFTVLSVFIVTTFMSIIYLIVDINQVALIQAITALISGIALFIYYKTSSLFLPMQLLITWLFLANIYRNTQLGGIDAPTYYTLFLIPIYACFTIGIRWSIIWTLLFISSAFGFHFAKKFGYSFVSKYSHESLSSVRIYTIFFANLACLSLVIAIKYFFNRGKNLIKQEKEEKSHLLKIITHDISSPLTSLSFSLQLLKDKTEGSETVDRAIRSLNAITNLIKEIKNFEAIKSGKQGIVKRAASWGQIFEELIFLNNDLLKEKNISLIVPNNLNSEIVYTDQTILVYQILNNLLNNAIKFSYEGGKITLTLQKTNSNYILTILDAGIGIPSEIQKKIFSPQFKTTRMGTKGEKGTGFGLPIVHSFVEMLDGEIKITSKSIEDFPDEHGTNVIITLPI